MFYQCSRNKLQLLFVWSPCPLWLFSDPSVVDIQLLYWLNKYMHLTKVLTCVILTLSNYYQCLISSFDYCRDVYFHGNYFGTMDLDLLKLCNFSPAINSRDVSATVPLFRILEWTCYHMFLYVEFLFPTRIFCKRIPGFATDYPGGVWCRGLTVCLLLFVSHFFLNLV